MYSKFLIFFVLLFVLFLIFSYKPFKTIKSFPSSNDSEFVFINSSILSKSLPYEFLKPTNLLASEFNSDYNGSSFLNTFIFQPFFQIHPSISLNNNYFTKPPISDLNLMNYNFSSHIKKYYFSTFGSSFSADLHKPIETTLNYNLYHTENPKIIYNDRLPLSLENIFASKLLEPVEFFILFQNSSMLGIPTISKSSGNEEVDNMILSHLNKKFRTTKLPDGYYRFALAPD